MAHKTLIGGTAYDITGGRTLIGGTAYSITKGRTLIGGTGYDIKFTASPMQAFCELMAAATISWRAGRNSSSTGAVSNSFGISYPVWVLSMFNGYYSFTKYTDANTKTVIYQSSASYGNVYNDGSAFRYSHTGASSTNVYGAELFGLTFTGYTENEIDTILAGVKKKSGAGRNSASSSTISLTVAADDTVLTAAYISMNARFGLSSPIGTVIAGDYTTNPSLLYVNGTTASLSTNGTSAASVYGGSVISLQEA